MMCGQPTLCPPLQIQQHPWFLKNLPEELRDGGVAMKEAAEAPRQSVEQIRTIVQEGRAKPQKPQQQPEFNEEVRGGLSGPEISMGCEA